jgi:membrane-associated phospholipid phosphatase
MQKPLQCFFICLTGVLTLFTGLSCAAQSVVIDSGVAQPDSVAKTMDSPVADADLAPVKDSVHHVYKMNYWVSGVFCAVASAADVYAIPSIIKSKRDITPIEFQALNPHVFNDFDRWALDLDPAKRDVFYKASDLVLPGIIVTTGILAFDKNIKKDWLRILVMYYEMHAITFSIYNFSPLGPAFQNKFRPYVYYNDIPQGARMGGNNRNSMYSGHTATAMASTFFMVKVYSDYHPEIGRTKYLLYGLAAIPPILEGYLRVRALAHFPSDGLIGVGVGALCGIMVPALHKIHSNTVSFSVTPTPAGPGVGVLWEPKGKHMQ